MKFIKNVLLCFAMAVLCVAVLGDTNSVTLPGPSGIALPTSGNANLDLMIAGATPVLVSFLKNVLQKYDIPPIAWPVLAPVAGIVLAKVADMAGYGALSTMASVKAGFMGVYLRELVDQAQKHLNDTQTPTPPVPPAATPVADLPKVAVIVEATTKPA